VPQAFEAEEPDAYVRTAIVRAHLSWWRRRSSRERVAADPPDQDGPRPDFADVHAVRDQLWRCWRACRGPSGPCSSCASSRTSTRPRPA
jgi:hypothetical protein